MLMPCSARVPSLLLCHLWSCCVCWQLAWLNVRVSRTCKQAIYPPHPPPHSSLRNWPLFVHVDKFHLTIKDSEVTTLKMWDVQLAPGLVKQFATREFSSWSSQRPSLWGRTCCRSWTGRDKINSVGPKSGSTWTAFEEMCVHVNSRR